MLSLYLTKGFDLMVIVKSLSLVGFDGKASIMGVIPHYVQWPGACTMMVDEQIQSYRISFS